MVNGRERGERKSEADDVVKTVRTRGTSGEETRFR